MTAARAPRWRHASRRRCASAWTTALQRVDEDVGEAQLREVILAKYRWEEARLIATRGPLEAASTASSGGSPGSACGACGLRQFDLLRRSIWIRKLDQIIERRST